MNAIVVDILIVLGSFLAMEGVTWLTHRYVMHGFLWFLHADHHRPHGHPLERNDLFFVIFAVPSFLLMLFGARNGFDPRFFVGMGITLYGLCYFLVHEVFIHQRLSWLKHTDSVYFRALRKAHKVHHKHLDKEHGECFGMLWVPWRYFREAAAAKRNEQALK